MIMRMKSNVDNFVDSYNSEYIDDTLNDYNNKVIPYYKKNTNKNTSGDEQQQDTSKVRFFGQIS